MGKVSLEKKYRDASLKQIDNEVVDIYKPKDKEYPIIERTTNALLWPEEIKAGIDLEDKDPTTQVPDYK